MPQKYSISSVRCYFTARYERRTLRMKKAIYAATMPASAEETVMRDGSTMVFVACSVLVPKAGYHERIAPQRAAVRVEKTRQTEQDEELYKETRDAAGWLLREHDLVGRG